MKIELVDYKTVRVTLFPADMESLSLSYESMDYKDVSTRRAIHRIMQMIRKQLALDLTDARLFIEAFPKEDAGCILYISVLEPIGAQTEQPLPRPKREISTTLAFAVEELDTLTALCRRIFAQYSHLVLESALYRLEKMYILILRTYSRMDKKLSRLALEYAEPYGEGEIAVSFVKEHATPVIPSDAVEKLVEYLS